MRKPKVRTGREQREAEKERGTHGANPKLFRVIPAEGPDTGVQKQAFLSMFYLMC